MGKKAKDLTLTVKVSGSESVSLAFDGPGPGGPIYGAGKSISGAIRALCEKSMKKGRYQREIALFLSGIGVYMAGELGFRLPEAAEKQLPKRGKAELVQPKKKLVVVGG